MISADGENLGVLSLKEALTLATEKGLDLVEVGANSNPPIAKIVDYGKYQYEQKKKQKQNKASAKMTETKLVQVKIGTGDNDLALKARRASEWLREGHRIKIELFLSGRSKYMPEQFLRDRLERVLHLISENYKIAEDYKKGPKGPVITIEKSK